MSQRTVKLGSLAPGINNRLEPTELATVLPDRSKGTYLYGADNVDINQKGHLKRRRGQTVVVPGRAHSLWGDTRGAFAVLDGELKSMTSSGAGLAGATVRAALPQLPLSYSRGADGDVYWSNGQLIRRVSAGVDRPIATEPPQAPSPSDIVVSATGALRAGRYLLAFTAISVDGESPATPVVQLDVPENGAIALTGQHHVFMSGPNGDILTYQGYEDRFVTHTENGRRCETLNLALMPAGTIVRHYHGRLLVASGNAVYASEPYNYGLYNPALSYFPFAEPVTVIEPTDNGLYICADKTYWIGDLFTDTLQEMLPYGAIPGTSGRSPNDDEVFWQSTKGLVIADKNAAVKNVQSDTLELGGAATGASLYRERDGMHHIVSTRFGAEISVAAATSYMDAEIIRKGTTL